MNRAELERYIAEIYSTQGENPWAQSPTNTVFRHCHNRKWFAIIMDIPRDKLGLPGEEIISAVNVKCDPRLIGSFREEPGIFPAYHYIGALWFGIGKTEVRSESGLDFVIMLAIAKVEEAAFRKDMFKSKRKPLEEIWTHEHYRSIAQIARFAPSACNTQPWIVESGEQELKVYRYQKPGKRGIMPADKVSWYNRIDIGIFLLFLEVCMVHEGLAFERTLFADSREEEKTLVAVYTVNKNAPTGA